jgi:hypothetical protein
LKRLNCYEAGFAEFFLKKRVRGILNQGSHILVKFACLNWSSYVKSLFSYQKNTFSYQKSLFLYEKKPQNVVPGLLADRDRQHKDQRRYIGKLVANGPFGGGG